MDCPTAEEAAGNWASGKAARARRAGLAVFGPRKERDGAPCSAPVSVVVLDPALRVLGVLVSPLGNEVEIVVGRIHHVDTPRVARIGVEHRVAPVPVKHADTLAVHHTG